MPRRGNRRWCCRRGTRHTVSVGRGSTAVVVAVAAVAGCSVLSDTDEGDLEVGAALDDAGTAMDTGPPPSPDVGTGVDAGRPPESDGGPVDDAGGEEGDSGTVDPDAGTRDHGGTVRCGRGDECRSAEGSGCCITEERRYCYDDSASRPCECDGVLCDAISAECDGASDCPGEQRCCAYRGITEDRPSRVECAAVCEGTVITEAIEICDPRDTVPCLEGTCTGAGSFEGHRCVE